MYCMNHALLDIIKLRIAYVIIIIQVTAECNSEINMIEHYKVFFLMFSSFTLIYINDSQFHTHLFE